METNTIIEGNKLIAEFMLKGKTEFREWTSQLKTGFDDCFIQWFGENVSEYHSSWNWLMPVVKKIIPPNGWQISGVKYQTAVINALTLADIEKIWLAVVEFIKWYNANK